MPAPREPITASARDGFRVCLFELGGHRLALRLDLVSEILPMAELSRPPSAPTILEGFLNLGGVAVPVIRLAEILGLRHETPGLHTPLIVVRAGGLMLALLVTQAMGIAEVRSADVVPIGDNDSFNGCVDGDVTAAGQTWHLLALDRVLLVRERQVLAEFQATETKRLAALEQGAP